ncbi:hypothetical protein B0J18DRAFT_23153 [Chaetomium sp. MPI-SDFR-AT-0129]|nr:hypothetical protein B0J18DRAFT_23153 [Chaetomium sp. MPI-SDFR-AT-0129]
MRLRSAWQIEMLFRFLLARDGPEFPAFPGCKFACSGQIGSFLTSPRPVARGKGRGATFDASSQGTLDRVVILGLCSSWALAHIISLLSISSCLLLQKTSSTAPPCPWPHSFAFFLLCLLYFRAGRGRVTWFSR